MSSLLLLGAGGPSGPPPQAARANPPYAHPIVGPLGVSVTISETADRQHVVAGVYVSEDT